VSPLFPCPARSSARAAWNVPGCEEAVR
jgi:hypothetical protein